MKYGDTVELIENTAFYRKGRGQRLSGKSEAIKRK